MNSSMRGLMDKVEDVLYGREEKPPHVFYHFASDDHVAHVLVRGLLLEDKTIDLGKGRSLMFHKAHNPPHGQDHIHYCVKGAKMYALNKDGTAHDRSHGVEMARWAVQGTEKHFPDFTIPPKGLIEALMPEPEKGLLLEGLAMNAVLVPPADLLKAEAKAG
jgi:hypothetical protein